MAVPPRGGVLARGGLGGELADGQFQELLDEGTKLQGQVGCGRRSRGEGGFNGVGEQAPVALGVETARDKGRWSNIEDRIHGRLVQAVTCVNRGVPGSKQRAV